jgi:Protein of unknown function (DUF2490)
MFCYCKATASGNARNSRTAFSAVHPAHGRLWATSLCCILLHASLAHAQVAGQLWTNVIVAWYATDRVLYRVDIEPKAQPFVRPGETTWNSLDVTPRVEFTLAPWIDLIGELDAGHQTDSDGTNSLSMTPRIGVELHILSRILQRSDRAGPAREKLPLRRLVVSSLVRLEHEDTFYSTGAPTKSSWQLRDRFALAYPLNRRKTSDDGAVYLLEDNELFIPLFGESGDPLVNQVRVRAGLGHRVSFAWRFEALYIWTGTRRADTGPLAVTSHALDVRIRRAF